MVEDESLQVKHLIRDNIVLTTTNNLLTVQTFVCHRVALNGIAYLAID